MTERSTTPHFDNILPFQNRVSCAIAKHQLSICRPESITVDDLHGNAWNFEILEGDAVYGLTDEFPEGPLDHLGEGDFVRVPYRRIPRVPIRSYQRLIRFSQSVRDGDDGVVHLWRGQTELHNLRTRRSEAELLKFYGTTNITEPSLLPSASRVSSYSNGYMDAWFGLLDMYADERHDCLRKRLRMKLSNRLEKLWIEYRCSYNFARWAMGVAQHYGLPSTGLDITSDIDVALFFALHDFNVTDSGHTTINRVHPDCKPIIYLFGIFEGDLTVDEDAGLPHMLTPRAKAQKAHFFHSAWGKCPNRAAERLLAVLDLYDHAAWEVPELSTNLFPGIAEDPYSSFLMRAKEDYPTVQCLVPLNRVYYR